MNVPDAGAGDAITVLKWCIKEYPAESGPAHVNVILNWFEEVKRRVPGAK